MGVPKFFRYMSERYPCLSEFVKEYQIPVFDNLYLDMNGIIHMCSHPDDNNPHFRITEQKLFSDIFHYIEILFRMIKPQKVFFMAIDGVAPRAKMNQQRGRRFRSAKDAEKSESDAKKKGEKLPETVRFDTNCITPGTEFMAKLHQQLKYFVVKKVSTDATWKKCKVILSGHETPGEGEHKIMDYIRYMRSQPGYDPNTRHCLYGLDADLIMLGLCTHDPHFSLLREEVKFGKKSTKRNNVPEEIRFFILHLSLMREYLELEFHPLKAKLEAANKFEFDIEKIIDDWVLMGFLVGNDFIPHLPNLHITNGALPILYKVYMDVLPKLDGYINESGTLNLDRFQVFMKELGQMDFQHFEETRDDLAYMESKTGRKQTAHLPVNSKGTMDPGLAALIQETDEMVLESSEDEEVVTTEDEDKLAFKKFKDEYYRNKLEYSNVTEKVMREQAEGYVRAIQWNLNYYYNGVCSWSWFYPHHYAPYISDIKDFTNFDIEFDLGKPFRAFEQLLAVLPAASKDLLPACYHPLMTDENSAIKDYYPEDFQTDLNGKRQEWEAVVLIPFIDENVLLEAMRPCNEQLTHEELKRNTHGPMLIYEYTSDVLEEYKAPAYFQTIVENHALCTPIFMEELRVDKDRLVKGAYPGARFDVFYPGFPTMKHLKYQGVLKKAKVKVFEQPSRNENTILKIVKDEGVIDHSNLRSCLKKDVVYVGWPHLVEAQVVGISDEKMEHVFKNGLESPPESKPNVVGLFKTQLEGVAHDYLSLLGVDVGETEVLVHVKPMIGRKYVITGNGRVTLDKQYSEGVAHYPLQIVVQNITAHDDFQTVFREVSELFPVGTKCFKVTNPHYGSVATVLDSLDIADKTKLKVRVDVVDEPDLSFLIKKHKNLGSMYMTLRDAACKLSISNYIFSRITGSLFITTPNGEGGLKQVNIGLNLKFNKKNQETPGYTKRVNGTTWLYSDRAVEAVREYHDKFPEILNYLAKNNDADDLSYDKVFGKDPDRASEVTAWLKSLPSHNVERRVCDSSVLDSILVEELERTLDRFVASKNDAGTPKSITMEVHPKHLFKPESVLGNLSPDPGVQTAVFDRIVNVRENFTVPLGHKGVVMAIHQPASNIAGDEMYDVIFDEPFDGGMSLNCSDGRAYRLPKTSFINIGHGQRSMGIQGQLRAKARENQNNSFKIRASSGNDGSGFENTRKQRNSAFATVDNCGRSGGVVPSNHRQQQPQHQPYEVQPKLDFMPAYSVKTNKENVSASRSKKGERPSVAAQISKPEKSKIEIDTECLKSLLKIGKEPHTNANGKMSAKVAPTNIAPVVQRLPISSIQSPAKAGPSLQIMSRPVYHPQGGDRSVPDIDSSSSATVGLLTFYQRNNLGCPRYDYFQSSQGSFAAQIVLPNQKVIVGDGSYKTREEASESVARLVLKMVAEDGNIFSTNDDLSSKFPVPPVNWVLPHQQQHRPQNVNNHPNKTNQQFMNSRQNHFTKFSAKNVTNVNLGHRFPQQGDSSSKSEEAQPKKFHQMPLSTNSFVPLQALKHQGNKNKHSDSINNPVQLKKEEKKQEAISREIVTKINQNVSQTDTKQKNPRHKKPKVAANFFMNKS